MGKNNERKKTIYFLLNCFIIVVTAITGTYAYFTAKKTVENAVTGETATVTFGLAIEKVTNVDNLNGLIPMDDEAAPFAAITKCEDKNNNAACQIYRINIKNTGNTNIFLDGYIELDVVTDDEMRFTRVYYDGDNFCIKERCQCESEYCQDEFDKTNVKTGIAVNTDGKYNRTDDINAIFVQSDNKNKEDILKSGEEKNYYVMIWLHNTKENQNDLQGINNFFTGKVTFLSSEGSEVTAVFE